MKAALEAAGQAWAAEPGGQRRLDTLRALVDAYVPAARPSRGTRDDAFWARRASDVDTHLAVAGYIATRLPAQDAHGLGELLDVLARVRFARVPARLRTAVLRTLSSLHADARRGLDGLRAITLMCFYGLPDEQGRNANWAAVGYPGPPEIPRPAGPRAIRPLALDGEEVVLDADVCVVGSGAGGGVIAGELARAGLDVVVLEAGEHYEDAEFPRDELSALRDLYWRGGLTPTADGNVALLAGATLGGGTTVNWTNCVLPPAQVRQEWAREHGLHGVDGPDFDEHLEAVLERIGATDACSEPNGPNARLRDGAEALGWSWRVALRNADPATYDAASAGHMGFGDRSGSKQTTTKTFLRDAVEAGARVMTRTRAERVLLEGDRAGGVVAVHESGGRSTVVTVHARAVVAACGALETPALLLRSGIGGPAVGQYLRLHPVPALVGFYAEEQQGWWGAPQTVVVDEFADLGGGYGFLAECPHFGTALSAMSLPWRSGTEHKRVMARLTHAASFIAIVREHGHGRVTIDDAGASAVHYPLDDPLDRHHLRAALDALARLHAAAGARVVLDLAPAAVFWRRGEDLPHFTRRTDRIPFGAHGRPLFSAHQMGTARMGTHPGTSVADPEGQLHDVRGVWVGDTSAFPSAVGSNPMVTCMALARRTAHALRAVARVR